jgi:hypothetical protein
MSELKPKSKAPASARVLETWIAQAERAAGVDGGRLGWLVATTVVTAALQRAVDDQGRTRFLLKGGTLLQHRLGLSARATRDLDGLVRGDIDTFLAELDNALEQPWGPLNLSRSAVEVIDAPTRVIKPRRFDVVVELQGKTWRRIQVEISPDEGDASEHPEFVTPPDLTGVGLPTPDRLVALALNYQVAQKIHAVTDPHDPPTSLNDRARDVVDLLLLRRLIETTGTPTDAALRAAIRDVFAARAADAVALGREPREWPTTITAHPHWQSDYARATTVTGIDLSMEDAVTAANEWLAEIEQSDGA